jgi:diaminohydroxyphosphoribosylaminopyrimidine deaminase/5-amino-6-(5-phosphoribosylamino)uracil reductase
MHRALHLARATVALASPNPQVGCVLVRSGEIVGEGAHLYNQRDHAEIAALKQAGERARGATAYVTLEPCSHQGRTGPCADALIAAGVSRVVAATVDPNPQVSGRGIERLRAAGIEVAVGILQVEARAINEAFAHSIRMGRPLVTLKAALSADGMLAPPPATRTTRQPHWLTGPESRAEVQRMRHAADAVLTGIGTVLADDPLLTDRSGLPRRRPLLRVVLDSHLRTPLDSQLVRSAQSDLLLICGRGAGGFIAKGSDVTAERIAAFEAAGVEVARVAESDGKLDLTAVLDVLAQRQITSLLLECGSRLNGAFLAQGLVDRVTLFHAPTNLGEDAVPFAAGYVSPEQLEQSLASPQRTTFGADTCVSALLHDPWS